MQSWDVRQSFLGSLPWASRYSRALLPLMPAAFARFDFTGYDVVIAASSAFSKNVSVPSGAANLCYCHTPPRYIWDQADVYLGGLKRRLASPLIAWLRAADRAAAARVTEFVANSREVARRVQRAYGRHADVIHPPVETKRFEAAALTTTPGDQYLVVSRLVRYKRIDLAIRACNALRRRLLIVGTGPERRHLEALAGPTVEFAGAVDDDELPRLYASCRAFLFPGFEDFGIAPVEAQAAGRPVVAYGAGGATETVANGVTGILFDEQSVDAVIAGIERLERTPIDAGECRTNAKRFDAAVFRSSMAARVAALIA